MEITWKDLLPCWGKHERMGHNATYGQFFAGPGESVICQTPALDGDDRHESTDATTQVLPMSGPAFYGFTISTEVEVMQTLALRRPWKPSVVAGYLETDDDPEDAGDDDTPF